MHNVIVHSVVPLDLTGKVYTAGEGHPLKLKFCRTEIAALLPFFGQEFVE